MSVTLALMLILTMCCVTAFASDTAISEDESYPTIELVNNKTVYKYPDDNTDPCYHICHTDSGFMKIVWKVIRFFLKIFGISEECVCGVKHY